MKSLTVLVKNVLKLKNVSAIKKQVENRLKEFSSYKNKKTDEWFSELCFCLLTANSKAHTAINIQKELGPFGFKNHNHSELSQCIRRNKHRFHNNKAKFIIEARPHIDIKQKISSATKNGGESEAREWLVKNIKGLGYKESSHFLRNTGHFNLAILDRHILNLMVEHGMLLEKPKGLNRKKYLDIEEKLRVVAKKAKMSMAELDFYMWYMKTGEVLK